MNIPMNRSDSFVVKLTTEVKEKEHRFNNVVHEIKLIKKLKERPESSAAVGYVMSTVVSHSHSSFLTVESDDRSFFVRNHIRIDSSSINDDSQSYRDKTYAFNRFSDIFFKVDLTKYASVNCRLKTNVGGTLVKKKFIFHTQHC
jgi:hypothetical protein